MSGYPVDQSRRYLNRPRSGRSPSETFLELAFEYYDQLDELLRANEAPG